MPETPAADDSPNGRERLIEAAVRLFARDGFDATSLRAVATESGVSWGLIRFYFGSKEGLREAVEARVVGEYLDRAIKAAAITSLDEILRAIEEQQAARLSLADVSGYLRRAIIEDRPMATEFVRRLIAEANWGPYAELRKDFPDETWLDDPIPAVARKLGYVLGAPQFEHLLGSSVFSVDDLKARNAQEVRMVELLRLGLETERTRRAGG